MWKPADSDNKERELEGLDPRLRDVQRAQAFEEVKEKSKLISFISLALYVEK